MMKNTHKREVKSKPGNDYFVETNKSPDYKDALTLKRYVTDRGKVMHQDYTNLTSKNQRKLSKEIKKARYMALLAYTEVHAL